MAREYLCVYHDMLPALEGLGYPEVGRLIIAALKYDIAGEPPASLTGKESVLWPVLMAQIDRNKAHYQKICETNRENVTKRYDRIRPNTTVYGGIQENRIEKKRTEQKKTEQSPSGNTRTRQAFIPPSREEVRAYARERNSSVDPDQFYDYFSEGNWIDSKGMPVRAWKQKFLTWEKFSGKSEADEKPDLSWLKKGR